MGKPIFDAIAGVYDETRVLPPDIMARSIEILASLNAGKKLLDVGVGTGRFAVPLQARGVDVTGIDLSCAMMSRCREKGFSQMMRASAFSMPFRDKSFGNALMVHVLHLMDDWKACLREVCRVTDGNILSVVSHWPKGNWPGDYYSSRVDELGYGPAQPGKSERELGVAIPPTQRIPVGTFTRHRDNDEYILQLERRQFSFATKLPDDLHSMVVQETRDRFGGGSEDVECNVEIYVWDVGGLSAAIVSESPSLIL